MKLTHLFVLFCASLGVSSLQAKVKLPAILGDNMVLQQQSKVKLWGEAEEESSLTVYTSWNHQLLKTTSDANGKWMVEVTTPQAGGPYEITFDDGDKTILQNIYSGEVWLCSGQSNMEMPVKGFPGQPVLHSNEVIANTDSSWPIRMFTVKKEGSEVLKDDVTGSWKTHTPQNVANFSATAYFFGYQLYKTLRTPIGLIHSSWGASNIETWMSEERFKVFYPSSESKFINEKAVQRKPCMLYNAMLYPLKDYKIKGTIWYQGEANRTDASMYAKLLPNFVNQLREMFSDAELPFYYVQIAPFPYKADKKENGALLREAQLVCEKTIPHAGMAVLMDIGEKHIIHPSHKMEVGARLAYWALSHDYGIEGITAESPRYLSKKIQDNKLILSFERIGNGLTSYGKELKNFEVAGEDKVFYPAKAQLSRNQVVVWSDKVKHPVAARYAFKNFVVGDLFNTAGLPVSSFRTDF